MDWQELLGWTDDQLDELRFSGFSFLRQGHYQKAITFFKALCILAPKSAYDLQTLGALYLQIGSASAALTFLERALNLEPTHEPTLLNKVKALFMNNRTQEALTLANQLKTSADLSIRNDALALISTHI
jgi:tetratricopeptide (TPR) repeat protein